MASEITDKVGLGVDLVGGPETLSMLRAIRTEMLEIARLSGKSSTAGSSTTAASELQTREKLYAESNKRIAEDRIRSERRVSEEEISVRAAALNRKLDIDRQVKQKAEQLRNEEKLRQAQAQREELAQYQRYLEERKRRVQEFSRTANATTVDLTSQRREFKKYRNDPARDPQTDAYRRALAEEIQGQRLAINERKRRILAFSQAENAADADLAGQRREFKKYRNDPARDQQTNLYRNTLSEEIRGQRIALREKRKLLHEEAILNKQAEDEAKAHAARRAFIAEAERRSYDPNVLRRDIDPRLAATLPSGFRRDIELDIEAQRLAKDRTEAASALAAREKDKIAAREAQKERRTQQRLTEDIRTRQLLAEAAEAKIGEQDLYRSAKTTAQSRLAGQQENAHVRDFKNIQTRTLEARANIRDIGELRNAAIRDNRPVATLQAIESHQQKAIAHYRELVKAESTFLSANSKNRKVYNGPSGPNGPNGPNTPNVPRFGDKNNVINPKGFFTSLDAVGRITRNIILYEAVSRASYGLVQYISNSLQAAKTTVEYANALRFATEAAGGNVQANLELADSLGGIGLSRQQGRAAVTQAARFTEGRPQDTAKLVDVATNIAAAYGDGIDKTDELIEQLRRRESKFYKRRFGKTVESIYTDEATKAIDAQTTSVETDSGLYVGLKPGEFKSRSDRIKEYVANMDDAAKEAAVLNYVLSQQGKFAGEADARAATLAGKIDKLNAAFLNGQEGLGLFITDLKVFKDLVDGISGKVGFLDNLRGPTLERTGDNGTISQRDIEKFGRESAYGPRADAIATIDKYAPLAATAIAGAGLFAFAGRKNAVAQAQSEAYDSILKTTVTKFKGDTAAAAQEATFKAKTAAPTVTRTIIAGADRISSSIATKTNDALAAVARVVGAEDIAAKATTRANLNRVRAGQGILEVPPGPQASVGQLTTGRVVGGAAGGYAGATIASFVADKITSNQIVATGITILGGAVGTAVGTAAGEAGASLLARGGATAFGIGAGPALLAAAAIGTAGGYFAEKFGAKVLGFGGGRPFDESQQYLKEEEAKSSAYRQQVRERTLSRASLFQYMATTGPDAGKRFSAEEIRARGDAVGDQQGGLSNYQLVRKVLPAGMTEDKYLQLDKLQETANAKIKEVNDSIDLAASTKAKYVLEIQRQLKEDSLNITNPYAVKERDEYRASQAKSIADRLAKDKAEADASRNAYVSQLGNALGKLREAERGSFLLPEQIGTSLAGDNPYVKVLADQATAAERMRIQWGFLGKAAVDYFTKLEQGASKRALNKLEYDTYTQATNFRGQAARERAERDAPGLSRRDQDYLDIQSAIVQKAVEIPKLWAKAAEVLGQAKVSPTAQLQYRIAELQKATGTGAVSNPFGRIEGFSAGEQSASMIGPDGKRINFSLNVGRKSDYSSYDAQRLSLLDQSPEVRRQLNEQYADAALSVLDEFSPQQIRRAGLANVYAGAINIKSGALQQKIVDARQKAQIGIVEDARLQRQLKEDEQFRQSQLAKGYDPKDVGRAADALVISRTDNISPKDMTVAQFTNRQEALRRQADRAEQDRQEAKAAVEKGLEYQKTLVDTVAEIREKLVGGDLAMLVQVQNDTQASIDQSYLDEASSGKYANPLDQRETKANPYSDPAKRYERMRRNR